MYHESSQQLHRPCLPSDYDHVTAASDDHYDDHCDDHYDHEHNHDDGGCNDNNRGCNDHNISSDDDH